MQKQKRRGREGENAEGGNDKRRIWRCMEKRAEKMASKTKVMKWNSQKANVD